MVYRNSILCALLGIVFITMGFIFQNDQVEDVENIKSEINYNLKAHLREIESEGESILNDSPDAWSKAKHSFFLMDSVQVLRWNNNDFLPDVRTVQDQFDVRLLRWPRGIFLLKKWSLDSKFLLAVAPLQNNYKINNRYLVSGWNKKIFPTQDVAINDASGPGDEFVWKEKVIFKVQVIGSSPQRTDETYDQFWIFILGLIFISLAIYFVWREFHQKSYYERAFMALLVSLIVGRVIMLSFFQGPNLPLFNPTFFASSSYNRSIGDLFINSIIILIPVIYLFFYYYQFRFFKKLYSLKGVARGGVAVLSLWLCFISVLYPFLFIETILHNSTISLDISRSLNFDIIRIVAYLSIIVGCATGFMLVHILSRVTTGLIGKKHKSFFIHLSVASLLFIMFAFVVQRDYWLSTGISIFYLILIHTLQLNKYLLRTTYITFLYFFIAIISFSIQGAFSVKRFVIEDKIDSQFRFANSFLSDRDYLGEYLLSEAVGRIAADPFIQTRLGSPFLSKTPVRQKVKQVYLNAYFDRYDIQIHLFNASGESHDNSTSLGFRELIDNFQQKATRTNFEGVYFLQNARTESTKEYIAIVPVSRFGAVTGYVVLDLSLKRIIPRNVFPELLLDDRFIQYFKNRDFSYAFFRDSVVMGSFGDFNYERNFSISQLADPKLLTAGITNNGYIHIGVEDEKRSFTLVSSPDYKIFEMVTNFSFFFTIGLILILIGLLFYGLITVYQGKKLNYSARIQLYVYSAFVLPLFLVSATTLGLISRSAENQLRQEYLEKSKLLGERLTPIIDSYFNSTAAGNADLENQLIELSRLANVDASVFLPSGKLLSSSQPLIYEDRILSTLIDRSAYRAIVDEGEKSLIKNEQVGSLNYNSAYFALQSPESGHLLGILSLPFFESAYSLEKTQINVVSNIITIFSIVFILFLALSFFAIRWLTFPLQFITKTLGRTSMTTSNKPLIWNANDEIGLMVNEYNKMLENLEQSKIELSRIQKESAWREIAKQVAHEVKNPLTPMKLTLQQLEHAMLTEGISKDKMKKSLDTLLQQVEILNDIAASFSAFARMPAPILEKIEITSLLKQVVNLHADYKEGKIELVILDAPIHIMGDGQLLSRVFSNILLNALQSGIEGKENLIKVSIAKASNKCTISFKDSGQGIDPDLLEKVFMPHFSTKKSGSGLGLAIAKQGVEQNGGAITFETESGKGTTFYIELPII